MVLCRSLPPSYQLLGDFGLALQPGQSRLLVHASHLLPGRQALAHDRNDLAVGCRFLRQGLSRQQIQSGPHLSPGHDRVGAAAVAADGLTIDTHQHREQAAHLVERPGGGPAEGAAISRCSTCSNKRSANATASGGSCQQVVSSDPACCLALHHRSSSRTLAEQG
jgi:hypothetical protein